MDENEVAGFVVFHRGFSPISNPCAREALTLRDKFPNPAGQSLTFTEPEIAYEKQL